MAETQNRVAPINIRARTTQRNLIDKAVALLSKNRSDFMLEVACREAENVSLDQCCLPSLREASQCAGQRQLRNTRIVE